MQIHTRPPTSDRKSALTLRRTPTAGVIRGTIVSDKMVYVPTHYWGGRTMPCTENECPACQAKRGKRWHAYIAFVPRGSRETQLLELTEHAAYPVYETQERLGTLRDVQIFAQRRSAKPNAAVVVTCTTDEAGLLTLPAPPDLAAALRVIWSIETSAEADDAPQYKTAADKPPAQTPQTEKGKRWKSQKN